ncbi:MAG TPA: ergothioneine biosynthesis protein EgtB [Acidimicrobiia bacterium]|nr:ergothioneine biosynthesis protein EgtB [Acidimicrobiia bacterium]
MTNLKQGLANDLDGARRRSLDLLDPLSEEDQLAQHSPLMSPLVWDLAHVGHYEELWLLRAVARTQPIDPAHDDIYDAFRHVRKERAKLAILGPAETRSHIAMVRDRVLDVLDRVELDPARSPAPPGLLTQGFVYGMVAQHEHQHDETILATLQLMASAYPHGAAPAPAGRPLPAAEVLIPGGPFLMGTDTEPFAYDNERPAHVVDVGPFFIDTAPVTNRAYLAFVESGGYDEPRVWSEAGWAHRQEAGLASPQFWQREGGGSWSVLRYGQRLDLPLEEPVQHVSWYEADAYARFAGKRLPTEAEWEKAAAGASAEPRAANLGQRHFGPAPVGAYPEGASRYGVQQMLGDVWEWTASDFDAYPGFVTFPYKEYSEVFYGSDYKVLRGGSWATSPLVARTTFRNWDYPIRRQIFAGFRCARDV